MTQNNLKSKLESLVFAATTAVSYKKLAEQLKTSMEEVKKEIGELNNFYEQIQSGLRLVFDENSVQMVTTKENSRLVDEFIKSEMREELTPAALETLSIVCYRGPIKKVDIDFIRGVNSTYTLRTLLMRGLIVREPDLKDARSFVYKPSLEFLKRLGVSNISALPEYKEITRKLAELKEQFLEIQQSNTNELRE